MRPMRHLLSASLCMLTLAACAGDENGLPFGLGAAPKGQATVSPDAGEAPSGEVSPESPAPSPSVDTVPLGFNSQAVIKLQRPEAVALDGGDNVFVASRPPVPSEPTRPYMLTVANRFAVVKNATSLSELPLRFAFQGTSCLILDATGMVTLDASLKPVGERIVAVNPRAIAVSLPGFPPAVRALSSENRVLRLLDAGQEEREFPNGVTPTAMAFDRQGSLWGLGATTLAKLDGLAANPPLVLTVSDLGTLKSLAVDSQEGVWVLGTTGLAYYDSAGNRQAGPFAVGGDRVFVRSSYLAVANFETGRLTRLRTDGTPYPGSSGLSAVTMPGGIQGAAFDSSGNFWVSSTAQNQVLQTKF